MDIPQYFKIANEWIRKCDYYRHISDYDGDIKEICRICNHRKDIAGQFYHNFSGSSSSRQYYFCSKDDLLIKCIPDEQWNRLPHCLNRFGEEVTSVANTLNPFGFCMKFIQKHIIDKVPIPDHHYGCRNLI